MSDRWYAVNEKLPKLGKHVLVFNGRMHEDYLAKSTNGHEVIENKPFAWVVQCELVGGSITHWREMPRNPQP